MYCDCGPGRRNLQQLNSLDLSARRTGTIGIPIPEAGLHATEAKDSFGLKLGDNGHGPCYRMRTTPVPVVLAASSRGKTAYRMKSTVLQPESQSPEPAAFGH